MTDQAAVDKLVERLLAATEDDQFALFYEIGRDVFGYGDPRCSRVFRLADAGAFLDAAMTLALPGIRAETVCGDDYSSAMILRGWGVRKRVIVAPIERPDDQLAIVLSAAWLRSRTTHD